MINMKKVSVTIKDYKSCRGGMQSTTFLDERGNSVEIDNETLYYMFRFLMHWMIQNDEWENFEEKVLTPFPYYPRIKHED